MIYRLDKLNENKINPITNCKYDNSWIILVLTDSKDYKQMCGSNSGCAYTVKVSRLTKKTGRSRSAILSVFAGQTIKMPF